METKPPCLCICFILLVLFVGIRQVRAQGTSMFNYQGQLQDGGTNANGTYTLIFALYDSASGGAQIVNPITNTTTVANGNFSVNLDFGPLVFNGSARWLDITITSGTTSQELSPRVQVLPTPYAIYAGTANTASNFTGTLPNHGLGGNYTNQLLFSNGSNSFNGSFAGDGSGMTNLNAYNITSGTLPGARLEGTYSNSVTFASVDNSFNGSFIGDFEGDGGYLTNVDAMSLGGIDSSNYVTFDDLTNLNFSSVPDLVVFETNGIYVVPDGVTKITVEIWGGGGAGHDFDTNVNAFGSGGGGGGYGKDVFDVSPGDTYIVTVGLGGTTNGPGGTSSLTFTNENDEEEVLISATGGFPGTNAPITYSTFLYYAPVGGLGGSSTNATINITGETGESGGVQVPGDGGNAGCGGSGGRKEGNLRSGSDNNIDPLGAESGHVPGGGGGGGGQFYQTTLGPVNGPGGAGGHGRVIISY